MPDFKKMLNRKSSAKSLQEKLQEKFGSGNKSFDDPNAWSYEMDKDGTAYAVIRFLPASPADIEYEQNRNPDISEEDVLPIQRRFEHGFREKRGFFTVCPTTWGEDCPVCNYNSDEIAKTRMEFSQLPDHHPVKVAVRKRARKTQYYANVLIIKDKQNPQNEGQVKVFKFGKMVYNHIASKLNPKFDDEEPVDVTDFMEGCNFVLKVYKDDQGRAKYDKCFFEDVAPLSEDVEYLEEIWKQEHPLHVYVDDSVKLPTEKIEQMLERAVGKKSNTTPTKTAEDAADALEESLVNNASTLDDDDELEALLNGEL